MRKQVLLCFLLLLAAALLGGCHRNQLAEGVLVESFLYETFGTAMGSEVKHSVVRTEAGYEIAESLGEKIVRTAKTDLSACQEMTDILREHDALSWNGYAKSDPYVLDGTSFTLHIVFDDGTEISAKGTNSRPKGLPDAMREIQSLFDRFLRESEQ